MTSPRRVLVIVEHKLERWALIHALAGAGFDVRAVGDAAAALEALDTMDDLALVIMSLTLGAGVVKHLSSTVNARWPHAATILLPTITEADSLAGRDGSEVLLENRYSVDDIITAAHRMIDLVRPSSPA